MPADPHDNTRRIGRGMMATGFVVGIILLTTFFDGVQRDATNPNRDPASQMLDGGVIEVHLEPNRQGHYLLTGRINGSAVDFILDTGATDVVVSDALARRAGLPYGAPSQAMTANGVVEIYTTNIDELRLGAIVLRQVRASINPSMHEDMALLGMSALRRVEFLQSGDQLTLRHYPN